MEQLTFEQLPNAVSRLYEKLDSIEKLLLSQGNTIQLEADQLLTIKEAAEHLTLSVPTLYDLVSRAAIPVSKRGKRLYFSKQELTEPINAGSKLYIIKDCKNRYAYNKKTINRYNEKLRNKSIVNGSCIPEWPKWLTQLIKILCLILEVFLHYLLKK